MKRRLLMLALGLLAAGCGKQAPQVLEGRPGGPYRLTLDLNPDQPRPGAPTVLTTRLTTRSDGRPVDDLQILHQRVVHNFIVNLDFSSFTHIHHEDFHPLTESDLQRATFSFPYTFPRAGHYRMVSEFTHHDRSWVKHFDIEVGHPAGPPRVAVDLARDKSFGPYRARLEVSPAVPVAGFETELVLKLARNGMPVRDLELLLGSEVHVALWRIDGKHFGHAHAYTPRMAAMLESTHDRTGDAGARARLMADMMVKMMRLPAELVYRGPRIPVHHVFPAPGVYAIFLQCAPGGEPHVFDFMLEIATYAEGMDTRIESMVAPAP